MLVKVAKNVCLFVDFIKGWNLHHILKHSGMVKEWTVTGNRKSSELLYVVLSMSDSGMVQNQIQI